MATIDLEIDLNTFLSLADIELPQLPTRGPLPEIPNKISFQLVKGIVVDSITNEPLPGVKVSNSFLKIDTTNKKGEFTINHPNKLV